MKQLNLSGEVVLLPPKEEVPTCERCGCTEDLTVCVECGAIICDECAESCETCGGDVCRECGLINFQGCLNLCKGCHSHESYIHREIEASMNKQTKRM